jgi:hypothetical protein
MHDLTRYSDQGVESIACYISLSQYTPQTIRIDESNRTTEIDRCSYGLACSVKKNKSDVKVS